jgi:hypothetical protein
MLSRKTFFHIFKVSYKLSLQDDADIMKYHRDGMAGFFSLIPNNKAIEGKTCYNVIHISTKHGKYLKCTFNIYYTDKIFI